MKKLKIKVGDIVRIVSGDHKGVEGKIMKVDFDKNKAIVEGANLVSKHEKPSAKNPQGGIVKKEALIHVSNLSLIDAKSGNTTRVGYEVRDGKKVRISKKSNEVI
ncbi:50S ribosomal protein L24 [Cellulophaga sp. Hel_I_12]|jgi:large subunit ribosomal protein L24|uniref:50S ribosomal protein L24 n=1 Tax=Cellulophaga sp. Hel_I_12 TaxID=1249972 RepID=UPI0006471F2E|nr:50S ribosomal protein L24 [Cellulophaga sp. Hel_I_12]